MFPTSYFPSSYFPGSSFPTGAGSPSPSPCAAGDDRTAGALSWLAKQLQAHASVAVVYRRGGAAVTVRATFGRQLFRLGDGGGGTRIERSDRDFLVPATCLVLDGARTLPRRGDTVTTAGGLGTQTYEVLAPGGEPPWRWSDPHRTMLRIHAKLVEDEDS